MKYLLYILVFTLLSCSDVYNINNSVVVYETLLSKLSNSNTSIKIIFLNESKPLHIEKLSSSDFYNLYGEKFPTLPKDAVEDFLKKNRTNIKINWKSILTDIIFVSENDLVNKENMTKYRFKVKDAKLYIEASQVGFSKDKHHAILSFYKNCGVLCSSGGIVHFVKRNEKYWVVEGQVTMLLQ